MKVRLSANARAYLLHEAAYLRGRNQAAARDFASRVMDAAQNLAAFPSIGLESKEHPVPGIRRVVVSGYLLDYEIAGDEVHVVAIRHGRQSPPSITIDDDFDYEA